MGSDFIPALQQFSTSVPLSSLYPIPLLPMFWIKEPVSVYQKDSCLHVLVIAMQSPIVIAKVQIFIIMPPLDTGMEFIDENNQCLSAESFEKSYIANARDRHWEKQLSM